ncbi:hypothetical protein DFJ74DRAFT_200624 [Hyaloraphidium curvatum]|nr:hypothetical protein DFJ74DRAFT_200624 [Hyaloraphidium curvatum]
MEDLADRVKRRKRPAAHGDGDETETDSLGRHGSVEPITPASAVPSLKPSEPPSTNDVLSAWQRMFAKLLQLLDTVMSKSLDPIGLLEDEIEFAQHRFRYANFENLNAQKKLHLKGLAPDSLTNDILPELPPAFGANAEVDAYFRSFFEATRLAQVLLEMKKKLEAEKLADHKERPEYERAEALRASVDTVRKELSASVQNFYQPLQKLNSSLAKPPDLVIASHPDAVYDLSTLLQALLRLLLVTLTESQRRLAHESQLVMRLISHNLRQLAKTCDQISVLLAKHEFATEPIGAWTDVVAMYEKRLRLADEANPGFRRTKLRDMSQRTAEIVAWVDSVAAQAAAGAGPNVGAT